MRSNTRVLIVAVNRIELSSFVGYNHLIIKLWKESQRVKQSSWLHLLIKDVNYIIMIRIQVLRILPGTYDLSMCGSCKNMWRHLSFWARGWPATLLMNISSPLRRSSMKSSSKSPSSPRNGICLFHALPGSGGTTILLSLSNSFRNHSKSEYRRLTLDSFNLKIGRLDCKTS